MDSVSIPPSFESLPTEVVIDVLSLVPDLPSLHHLLVSSPKAFRTFHAFGPGIFENVVQQSVIDDSLFTMSRIALVRRSTAANCSETDLQSFIESYVQHRVNSRDEGVIYESQQSDAILATKLSFNNLLRPESEASSGFSAREFLILARRVATLAHECLSDAYEHCLAAKPSQPGKEIEDCGIYTWCDRFESVPFTPKDHGPPSWIEMQRMMRGFWRLQLLNEIKSALCSGRLGWPNGNPDANTIEERYIEHLGEVWGDGKEELLMAMDFVKGRTVEAKDMVDGNGERLSSEVKRHCTRLPTPRVSTGKDSRLWPNGTEQPPISGLWKEHMNYDAPGYRVAREITWSREEPYHGVPMREYRRLGFTIWDWERLRALGLVKEPGTPQQGPIFDAFGLALLIHTWRSFLDDDALERANENAKREFRNFQTVFNERTDSNEQARLPEEEIWG